MILLALGRMLMKYMEKKKLEVSSSESNLYVKKSSSTESSSNETNLLNIERNQAKKSKKTTRLFGKVRVSKDS